MDLNLKTIKKGNNFIEVKTVQLGYCHQCLNSAIIGEVKLRGWIHLFHVCSRCLEKLAKEIDSYQYKKLFK